MDLRRRLTLNLESAYHHIHFCLPFFLKSALRHDCPRIPSRASKGQRLIPCSHALEMAPTGELYSKDFRTGFLEKSSGYDQTAWRDAWCFWPVADIQIPTALESGECLREAGAVVAGKAGSATCAVPRPPPRSHSFILSRSQKGRQICQNMPECGMGQLSYEHVVAAPCSLLS